jgi:hypothetical protein
MSGGNKFKPNKLNHEKRFIDIASHWNEDLSIALSLDNILCILLAWKLVQSEWENILKI